MNCEYCKEPLPSLQKENHCERCACLAEYDETLVRLATNPNAAPGTGLGSGFEIYTKVALRAAPVRRLGSNRRGWRKQPDGTWKKMCNEYATR